VIASKLLVLLFGVFSFSIIGLSKAELPRLSIRYFQSSELTRIPEYFSGKEFTGKKIFCRSTKAREGIYFSFPIPQSILSSPEAYNLELSIIRNGSTETEIFSFTLPYQIEGKKEIFVGITGKDWPKTEQRPSAWHMAVKDSKGSIILWKKSFLWEHE
jgi:hypothetical protein